MTTRDKLKHMIDETPDDILDKVGPLITGMLKGNKNTLPKIKLGIYKPVNRNDLYDDVMADRY